MFAKLRNRQCTSFSGSVQSALTVAAGTLALLWPALLNHSPLFYPDSILYLEFGPLIAGALVAPLTHPLFEARSEFYSLGIWVLDRGSNIWPVIFFQALVTAYVLWLVVRWILPVRTIASFLSIVILLSALSGLSWVVCWVLTDLFGGLAYLCLCLLVLGWDSLSRAERWLVSAIGWLSMTAHISHLVLAIFVCGVLGLVLLLRWAPIRESGRRFAFAVGLVIFSVLSQSLFHLYLYGKPMIAGYRPPYLLARVIADGPGLWYLREHCSALDWVVCKRVNTMPATSQDILWGPESLWEVATPEMQRQLRLEEMPLVLGALRTYPMEQVGHAWHNMWGQAGAFCFDEFIDNYWIVRGLDNVMPRAGAAYKRSLQAHDELPIKAAGKGQLALIEASGAALLVLLPLSWKLRRMRVVGLAAVLLPAVLANAFVCGALSQVDERLQLRVIWLVPFVAMLTVLDVCLRPELQSRHFSGQHDEKVQHLLASAS